MTCALHEKDAIRSGILVIDSGNSRIHWGVFDGSVIKGRLNALYPDSEQELISLIENDILGDFRSGIVAASSVSGRWRDTFYRGLASQEKFDLRIASTAEDIPVEVQYDNRSGLGVDRVYAAYAAWRHAKQACVVIDAGTAVTVDAVDKNGTLLGGFIFPGADLFGWSLSEKTALPNVPFARTDLKIGTGTESCIGNAIYAGFRAALDELVRIASSASGTTSTLVVTGGHAEQVLEGLCSAAVHRPDLTLEGIGFLAKSLPKYCG